MKEFIIRSNNLDAYVAEIITNNGKSIVVTTTDPAEAAHFASPADAVFYTAHASCAHRIADTRSWEVALDPNMYDC